MPRRRRGRRAGAGLRSPPCGSSRSTSRAVPRRLRWRQVPDPTPDAGEVVVELAAAGLNYIDTYHRSGLYAVPLPYTLGLEGAGTVIAVGDGVASVSVGDRVAWAAGPGSYAEQVVVPAEQVGRVPEGVSLEVAAAVLLQGMTAHYLTHDTFPLGERPPLPDPRRRRRRRAAVDPDRQVARCRGVHHRGLAREGRAGRRRRCRSHDPLPRGRLRRRGRRMAGPRPLDVVYDGVGGSTFSRGLGVSDARDDGDVRQRFGPGRADLAARAVGQRLVVPHPADSVPLHDDTGRDPATGRRPVRLDRVPVSSMCGSAPSSTCRTPPMPTARSKRAQRPARCCWSRSCEPGAARPTTCTAARGRGRRRC